MNNPHVKLIPLKVKENTKKNSTLCLPYLTTSDASRSYNYNEFIDFFSSLGIKVCNYLIEYNAKEIINPIPAYSVGKTYPFKTPMVYEDTVFLKSSVTDIGVYLDVEQMDGIISGRNHCKGTYNSPMFWWSLEEELKHAKKLVKSAQNITEKRITEQMTNNEKDCYSVYVDYEIMDYLVVSDCTGKKVAKVFIRPFIKVSKNV